MLLAAKADVDAADGSGMSPLHYAAMLGASDAAGLLLGAGADAALRDEDGASPLDVAEERDPKGLYKKARAGELKGFTGIDDPYEAPEQAELHLRTDQLSVAESVQVILDMLEESLRKATAVQNCLGLDSRAFTLETKDRRRFFGTLRNTFLPIIYVDVFDVRADLVLEVLDRIPLNRFDHVIVITRTQFTMHTHPAWQNSHSISP